ncbi:MAG TPA: hypothetical protein VK752_28755 [Bryobacteraceae bacterium]|jgi:hypothetical protein|nr:hypothetical protein [Bryobacteraceae bacterium]
MAQEATTKSNLPVTELARAKFANGVLRVTVPLEERASDRRQIPVEAASQAGSAKKG